MQSNRILGVGDQCNNVDILRHNFGGLCVDWTSAGL